MRILLVCIFVNSEIIRVDRTPVILKQSERRVSVANLVREHCVSLAMLCERRAWLGGEDASRLEQLKGLAEMLAR